MNDGVYGQYAKEPTLATPFAEGKNVEDSNKGERRYKRQLMFRDGFTATTSYKDSEVFDARFFQQKSFFIVNPDATNNLLYQILCSIDGVNWTILLAETTITPKQATPTTADTDGADRQDDAGAAAFYKFQVKTSGGTMKPIGVISAWA